MEENTGGTNHHQAVGSGGRPAPHNPLPSCTWTDGLGTARSNAEEEWKEMVRLTRGDEGGLISSGGPVIPFYVAIFQLSLHTVLLFSSFSS